MTIILPTGRWYTLADAESWLCRNEFRIVMAVSVAAGIAAWWLT